MGFIECMAWNIYLTLCFCAEIGVGDAGCENGWKHILGLVVASVGGNS